MLRGGGAQPGPGVPALALGAGPGRADLPAPPGGQQRGGGLLAGEPHPAGRGEVEVRRDPQHVRQAAGFQVLPQLGAAAVDLVPAGEVQADAVGKHLADQVDGQLPLGPEGQVRRQPHDPPPGGVLQLLARDPLPCGDQRVPDPLARVRQVHRGDPVGHLPGAAQIVAFDAGRALALLDLAGLIDRADRQPAAAAAAGGLVQPGDGEPAHRSYHRGGIPGRPAEQPLHPVRRPVPGPLGQRPTVTPGQIAHQRGGVLACLQPRFHPGETRAQQFQQLCALPPAQGGAYPDGSSRLRFCCLHKRMIARRLRCVKTYATLTSRSKAEWLLPY